MVRGKKFLFYVVDFTEMELIILPKQKSLLCLDLIEGYLN